MSRSTRTVLVTGGAGFIGSHVTEALLRRGERVVVIDNFNAYYDPRRKHANVEEVRQFAAAPEQLILVDGDIRDRNLLGRVFGEYTFDAVVHLAAMAGVRASIADPALYFDVNLNGTLALLDASAGRIGPPRDHHPIFILASTSSVYGDTKRIPFVETDPCDRPLAPYAASKRAAELTAFTYHHLYGLDVTVPRFFTVYGPRGRPDMMAFKVADSMYAGNSVPLFNDGQMYRDWTYVGDIVNGLLAATERRLGYEVVNLGRGQPVLLADFVRSIEDITGRPANLVPAPPPDTDILSTHADTSKAHRLLDYSPKVSVPEGVRLFLDWYSQAVSHDHAR
jgi:UDP-glucuronate 4-epimerase